MNRNAIAAVGALAMLSFYGCGSSDSDANTNSTDTVSTEPEANVPAASPYTVDPQINGDNVAYSFVFVGCNRIDRHDVDSAGTDASTANIPELKRTFNEVANLNPQPKYFFFLGDLVLGLDTTSGKLAGELSSWVSNFNDPSFSDMANSPVELIAVPGNHEMLWYNEAADAGNGAEQPWEPSMEIWEQEVGSFKPNAPMNTAGTGVQRGTYSFNYNDSHFILINTDTYDQQEECGNIPATWIVNDIEAARADTSINHIFLMGHKPSYIKSYQEGQSPRSGIDIIQTGLTDSIWPVMESNQVEAMLSAHSHQYWRSQPDSNATGAGDSYQIVAGNGGSPYVKHLPDEDKFYGYTIVYVMLDGTVQLRSMGRSIGRHAYMHPIPAGTQTTVRDAIEITWGSHAPAWN